MKDLLLFCLKGFLSRHFVQGKRVALGFSGGPDSTALLHLLHECKRFFPLDVDVIHIDHGWRAGSGAEAEGLKTEVERLGLPFILRKIPPPASQANMEEKGREERIKIFASLQRERGYQAVILGHQADDQAETVLKRVLEGAHLMALGGMEEVSMNEGVVVWRPLLSVKKEKILAWLKKRGISSLDDPANVDSKFLRGRMRSTLFPEVVKVFGKDATLPLTKVGHAARELKEYLERKVEPYLQMVRKEGGQVVLDLSQHLPMERLELKTVLRILARKEGAFLSFEALETLCNVLNALGRRKKVGTKSCDFYAHRGVLTINLKEQ